MFVHLALIVWYLHVYKVIGLNTSCCDSYHLKRQNGELWTCGNCHPGYHFADDCEFNGGSAKCSPCSDGYFMETRNVFRACRPCKNSCPHNTIIDFNCSSTSDLKCGCSNDKYLDKDVCVRKTKCQPGYGVSGTTAEGDTKCDSCPEGTVSPNYSFDEKCMPDTDDCAPMPCMNNGTCIDLVDDFNCTCPRGISGRRCEHGTGCDSQPCQNGGRCIPEGILHLCDCPDGFKGPNCEDTCPTCKSSEHVTVIIVLAVLFSLCAIVVIVLGVLAWQLRTKSKRGNAANIEELSSLKNEKGQQPDEKGPDKETSTNEKAQPTHGKKKKKWMSARSDKEGARIQRQDFGNDDNQEQHGLLASGNTKKGQAKDKKDIEGEYSDGQCGSSNSSHSKNDYIEVEDPDNRERIERSTPNVSGSSKPTFVNPETPKDPDNRDRMKKSTPNVSGSSKPTFVKPETPKDGVQSTGGKINPLLDHPKTEIVPSDATSQSGISSRTYTDEQDLTGATNINVIGMELSDRTMRLSSSVCPDENCPSVNTGSDSGGDARYKRSPQKHTSSQ
ncbi:delta-like protein 1 isoform X2 [Mya arenaria]|uniref:delta-like protein 1 isoform X2 n=1 Tax=Mya arenaria TaxID=6604 RepID=UPI0022E9256C|nr:delta-like protein 1 isoform X2 [Mya arenaria]